MSIEKEFAVNRKIIVAKNSNPSISIKAFRKFEQMHGPEVAKGYLLALHDVYLRTEKIKVIDTGSVWQESTPTVYKNRTKLFHDQLEDFLNQIKSQSSTKTHSPDF